MDGSDGAWDGKVEIYSEFLNETASSLKTHEKAELKAQVNAEASWGWGNADAHVQGDCLSVATSTFSQNTSSKQSRNVVYNFTKGEPCYLYNPGVEVLMSDGRTLTNKSGSLMASKVRLVEH